MRSLSVEDAFYYWLQLEALDKRGLFEFIDGAMFSGDEISEEILAINDNRDNCFRMQKILKSVFEGKRFDKNIPYSRFVSYVKGLKDAGTITIIEAGDMLLKVDTATGYFLELKDLVHYYNLIVQGYMGWDVFEESVESLLSRY